MKRFYVVVAILLLLTGCGNVPDKTTPIRFDSIPGEIVYNDTTISLSDVSFGEVYADHGYTGYCVVTVDRSNLTDDDVYWMLKKDLGDMQAEFEVNAYLSSESNALNSEYLSSLRTTYDNDSIYFFFYTKDVQREHLSDFEIDIQLIVSPEKSLTADTTQYYYFDFDAEAGVDYSDYDSVFSEKERNYLIDALNARVDDLKHGI